MTSNFVFVFADEIKEHFVRFGPLTVDWPHKAQSKAYFPPKGDVSDKVHCYDNRFSWPEVSNLQVAMVVVVAGSILLNRLDQPMCVFTSPIVCGV